MKRKPCNLRPGDLVSLPFSTCAALHDVLRLVIKVDASTTSITFLIEGKIVKTAPPSSWGFVAWSLS